MGIQTQNICLSMIKALTKKFGLQSKIIDNSNYEYNIFTICAASNVYLKSDILHVIYDTFNKYQKLLPIETMYTANFKGKDATLNLGLDTQIQNYYTHVGGMLYDESYVRNEENGFCLIIDISHIITDIHSNNGSLVISIRANKFIE